MCAGSVLKPPALFPRGAAAALGSSNADLAPAPAPAPGSRAPPPGPGIIMSVRGGSNRSRPCLSSPATSSSHASPSS